MSTSSPDSPPSLVNDGTLDEISRNDLGVSSVTASITNVKYLASYNWIKDTKGKKRTIAVPGSPALWRPPPGDFTDVKEDHGLVHLHPNAAFHRDSPLESLFRALYMKDPSYTLDSVDIVVGRDVLSWLLEFVTHPIHGPLRIFALEAEVVQNTVLLCRVPSRTVQYLLSDRHHGYQREFKKAYTSPQIQGDMGHQRIISYQLSGMKLIVRHEMDACIRETPPIPAVKREQVRFTDNQVSLGLMAAGGPEMPMESTLEIKTFPMAQFSNSLTPLLPDLWLSQTPNLVRAYHENGQFDNPEVENITDNIKAWEKVHQPQIQKLVSLLQCIVEISKLYSGSNIIFTYDHQRDILVVTKREKPDEDEERAQGGRLLPDDLYRWFEWGQIERPNSPSKWQYI
ncbi:hypothetical protein BDV18DRAFT_162253 [Aspergillus unguis]